MDLIPCGDISQALNSLQIKLNTCKTPTTKDLQEMLTLLASMYECSLSGGNYNKLVSKKYEGKQEVVFPQNTFHSFSLNVLKGSIEYEGVNFPAGSTRNVEYSTLNFKPVKFKVNLGSEVFMEYLTIE